MFKIACFLYKYNALILSKNDLQIDLQYLNLIN